MKLIEFRRRTAKQAAGASGAAGALRRREAPRAVKEDSNSSSRWEASQLWWKPPENPTGFVLLFAEAGPPSHASVDSRHGKSSNDDPARPPGSGAVPRVSGGLTAALLPLSGARRIADIAAWREQRRKEGRRCSAVAFLEKFPPELVQGLLENGVDACLRLPPDPFTLGRNLDSLLPPAC